MNLFKNYDKEFENLQKEIGALKSRVTTDSDRDLIKIQSLEDEIKELKVTANQMVVEVIELKQFLLKQEPTGMVSEEVEIADEPPLKYKKGKHISQFTDFKRFSTPRYYDLNGQFFYLIGKEGIKYKLHLTFQQLVALIKGYTNNLSVKKMKQTNPLLNDFSEGNLHQFIYYWRAGGFNQAIRDNARKLGYNPEKLISHECDDL